MTYFYRVKENPEEGIDTPKDKTAVGAKTWKTWLKRIGIAGFLFFLVKGLIWVGIFLFAAKGCS